MHEEWTAHLDEQAAEFRALLAGVPRNAKANGGGCPIGMDLLQPGLHDAGNAERIILLFGGRLRYCHPMRRWLVWDGRRWRPDERDEALRLAKETMSLTLQAAIAAGAETVEKWAVRSLDARRLEGALKLAQPDLAVSPDELDADHDVLNVDNGTLHLPTGTLRPHDPAGLITKLAPVRFDIKAECPRFDAFINRILGANGTASAAETERAERLKAYIQAALGYSTTGWTREKAVFVPYGPTNGGKSTLLSTIRNVLGDYSTQIMAESLMASRDRTDANQLADMADLRGARFVVTSETEEGQYFSQARLKRITQGMGLIKAVRKYENPVEFKETHKLWLDTNRRPRLRDADDDATLKRLHPIPFTVSIPEAEQDRSLPEKLMSETPGILLWLAAGALSWYSRGLERPPEILAAREEWRNEDDQMARFLDDCCHLDPDFEQPAGELYKAYRKWCEETGEHTVLSAGRLKQRLSLKGIGQRETSAGRLYKGVQVKDCWK